VSVGSTSTRIQALGVGPEGSEQASLRRYLDVLKARWWLIAMSVVLCTGAAALYVLTADKVYQASADMLVTPVADDAQTFLGLGLIRRASDPTRDVTTAARLINNGEVAERVKRELGGDAPANPLARLSVEPVAQSSIVAVTAQGDTPREAQRVANAFGEAAVAERTEQLHRQLDPMISRLRQRRVSQSSSGATRNEALDYELATLESLRAGPDPTLRLETPAGLPADPVSPRPQLSILGGVFAGLLLGVVGVFALNLLDPRAPREELLGTLGLPVLARVPRRGRSTQSRHAFDEAFRFLRTMIRFASQEEPVRTIAVTSATESEGKTTTSFQLAMAALEAGQTVLLVEADAYRPALWEMLDLVHRGSRPTGPGLLDYLDRTARLDDLIKPTAVPGLSFVPAGPPRENSISGLLERQRGRAFVGELSAYADVVILDCPPVGPRADAVLLAAVADAVVFVVDLQQTSERMVAQAVERLRDAHGRLLGAVINRDEEAASASYYGPAPSRDHTQRSSGQLRSVGLRNGRGGR
jgi:capsular exopolysaccharide synthesis family protein